MRAATTTRMKPIPAPMSRLLTASARLEERLRLRAGAGRGVGAEVEGGDGGDRGPSVGSPMGSGSVVGGAAPPGGGGGGGGRPRGGLRLDRRRETAGRTSQRRVGRQRL